MYKKYVSALRVKLDHRTVPANTRCSTNVVLLLGLRWLLLYRPKENIIWFYFPWWAQGIGLPLTADNQNKNKHIRSLSVVTRYQIIGPIKWESGNSLLTLMMSSYFGLFFSHSKLELLTQFPAPNDEKEWFLRRNNHLWNFIFKLTKHLPHNMWAIPIQFISDICLKTNIYGPGSIGVKHAWPRTLYTSIHDLTNHKLILTHAVCSVFSAKCLTPVSSMLGLRHRRSPYIKPTEAQCFLWWMWGWFVASVWIWPSSHTRIVHYIWFTLLLSCDNNYVNRM